MCPELPSNKTGVKTPDLEEKLNVSLLNHCAVEEVLLQTLQVDIKAGGKTRRVRALIDSGSQRSYLLKKAAEEMNLKPVEMKNILHSVFGGSTLRRQDHRLYEITLQNVNNGFSFDIQILDQPIICGKIPRINKGIWEKGLKRKNIILTDHGRGYPDIELLI
ncbi:integrase catalytic domain-containing protein [Trichonephila clavata]|uniref:Integrase catalytic domain-containing protein n=1 Tax=Trichonephila clavata TaxID=2740835 RepID=A0A8X6J998_TRICU|nr:integrase catalytic domain-containing protein [Trichonephila clavata]